MKYKFEEIAFNINTKIKPNAGDEDLYIGLEHLNSNNLFINNWGSRVALKGDKLLMSKGDILFGKRNAYLKRVGIAPFDGIFSAHGMIFRANEEVISKDFFPFFIMSDYFMDAAIKISVGSLSPTINWSDLKVLEFDLPSLEEQERLAKILWKIEESKTQASDSIKKINNLIQVTSKKDYESFCQFDLKKIKELLEVQKKSGIKAGESLSKGEYIFFTSGSSNAWYNKYLLDGEYLIFNTGGSMLIQYYNGKFSYSTDTMVIKCKDNLTKYLFYYLSSINDELDYNFFRGSGLRHLNKKEFFNMDIKIPSKEKIDDFVNKLENLNSIKKQLLIDLKDKSFLQKQILKEAFNV